MIEEHVARVMPEGSVLDERQLNRALLARQHVLSRSELPVETMLAHLVGMQSQVPNDPFIALWSRVQAFTPDRLSDLMLDRSAVRGSLMRGTIHVVTTPDYLALYPFTQPLHQRVFPSSARGKTLPPQAVPEILAAGRELLRASPMSVSALGKALAERWGSLEPEAMAQACRFLLPLVQVTPRGVWGASMAASWAHVEDWAGASVNGAVDQAGIIRRYLSAFGPATVADIGTWSGVTGLKPLISEMQKELVIYRNEQGQELFDMPEAPMPPVDTPAPVRFLPGFDNILLSHKNRTRIISEERRRAISSKNGLLMPTWLVDGFVSGTWSIERGDDRAVLFLHPFEQLARAIQRELEEEGDRLLAFTTGIANREVRFNTPSLT